MSKKKPISKTKTGRQKGEVDLRRFVQNKAQTLQNAREMEELSSSREIVQDIQALPNKEMKRKIKCIKKEIDKAKNNIKRLLRTNQQKDEEIEFLRTQILRHKK